MGVELLVVDNDPIAADLSSQVLQAAGFQTQTLLESRQVIAALQEIKPRGVLLDIMMPGVDGLTLCRAIKSDPQLKDIKVIMVSGKSFKEEQERAQRFGADLFIEKPYDINTFAQRVSGVVGPPQAPVGAVEGPKTAVFTAKVWGSRGRKEDGSLRTPCLSLETQEHLFILDAGTGIVPLGEELAAAGQRQEFWLLLTHTHQAHIEGLGGFSPLRETKFKAHIVGPADPDRKLETVVQETLQASLAQDPSPVQATIALYELDQGDYNFLPGVRLSTLYTNHPSQTLAYRIEVRGRKFVYCPDGELHGGAASALQDYDEQLERFCRGADLLVHDARWKAEDFAANQGKGHSSLPDAVEFAAVCNLPRLWLFHMDGSYSDADLDAMEKSAQELAKSKGSVLECRVAREGLSLAF